MFGGPPPQLSAEELKAQEAEATLTVQRIIVGSILLYLCKISSLHLGRSGNVRLTVDDAAPFAIDAAKKLF
ncbi:hypothetical protein M430DRAFT_20145 [Amorphotheca resinae ATCC 22711]|uniref:Uncharacterized protein n=1 Tax=Amorphotheca resinae ATCC 22711 TaxID=857342 RepID=A0A2T3AXS2_AMORE|nr:hypothetical protein M430DRAFT_20145 [Amorphotheca resinae ATCC 22711]PSS14822.1 hypothetical protein M430DRAFT_20145 [Amorphotheca resinae ATCC 22711]